MMKKVVLIAVIALIAFCSCEKINLIEQVPQLKGSWQWHQTTVGGVVGVIHPETTQSLVLAFEDDNKISIEYNGETVVSGETYTCKKSNDSNYGEYVISLPKEVKTWVLKAAMIFIAVRRLHLFRLFDEHLEFSIATHPTFMCLATRWKMGWEGFSN